MPICFRTSLHCIERDIIRDVIRSVRRQDKSQPSEYNQADDDLTKNRGYLGSISLITRAQTTSAAPDGAMSIWEEI